MTRWHHVSKHWFSWAVNERQIPDRVFIFHTKLPLVSFSDLPSIRSNRPFSHQELRSFSELTFPTLRAPNPLESRFRILNSRSLPAMAKEKEKEKRGINVLALAGGAALVAVAVNLAISAINAKKSKSHKKKGLSSSSSFFFLRCDQDRCCSISLSLGFFPLFLFAFFSRRFLLRCYDNCRSLLWFGKVCAFNLIDSFLVAKKNQGIIWEFKQALFSV